MSDNKKYYYMKVKETFFDNEEMKLLESQQNGAEYQLFYMKICLLSLKNEGALICRNIIPYDIEMLATITRTNIDTVKTALEIFKKIDLITILDNETIYMTDIQSLVGKSSTEAERQKEYRYRISRKNVTNDVTNVTSKTQNRTPESRVQSLESRDKREERATNLPTSNSQKELRANHIKLIVKACSNFAITATELYHIPAFKSPQNQEILFNNLKNAKYDIEQCINKALEKTKQDLRAGKSNKPLFDFRDLLYIYLMYGGVDISRMYTQAELEERKQAKEKRELGQKELEQEETRASALEVEKYEQETALLFDIEIGDVEAFSQKYEGGMIAFFDERRRREEINNQEVKTKEECYPSGYTGV